MKSVRRSELREKKTYYCVCPYCESNVCVWDTEIFESIATCTDCMKEFKIEEDI